MRIVMDFDGVYTDPSDEGEACSRHFRDKILSLGLKEIGLDQLEKVEGWLGELRARQATQPFLYGWRSEGRVSAFTFEDPFIRNIGLADFLDYLAGNGDAKAKQVLTGLKKQDKIESFGQLSEWSFHQLKMKKKVDPAAKKWVMEAIEKGHEVTIVSNSAAEKIEEFLNQNGFPTDQRPNVRGGAMKFGLGKKPQPVLIAKSNDDGEVQIDTDRPYYEEALLAVQPDAVIGDVFCLDLSLPIRLQREGKLKLAGGIFYRHRDYTPSKMVDLVTGKNSLVPEVTLLRDWSQVKI
jgi:FMN phosphatase YigB (HAD superfamily)